MMRSLAAMLLAALLVGCATKPPGSPTPAAPPPLAASGLSPALEAQRLRLSDAVSGTPVVVVANDAGQLQIEVPLKFAFDPGRASVKPPLAAVLDQLATGYKPHVHLSELRIGAPTDDKGAAALAQQRAQAVRDYLVGRGVPAGRIVGLGRAERPVVEVVVSDRPAR